MSSSIKTRPDLWDKIKKEVIRSPKGGPVGKWSARKAQRAVAIYKDRGGRYVGKKSPYNSLVKWTKEDWGYINDTPKKSKRKSKRKSKSPRYGRYLPLEVRKKLTSTEKDIENRKKGKKYGQWVPYTKSVLRKVKNVLSKSIK